uniref:Thiol:disulfide interchange protein n=1 Tax=Hydropuntia rangiferina TaxID=338881 RepID=A0A345U844_9FLOR|nr:thiol:disulfide interchange protein [Hydropuntia rangiferina]AXI96630.1 thiol:disulfide interchange protein [Hydropuntia rangiferina]UAD87313.1 thiol:disulfide interchange protein [Hydropuntia rangiferina]
MIHLNFISTLNLQMYFIEQNCYSLLTHEINNNKTTTFILLLISGFITSLNPCLLSIIPISLSYIYSKKLYSKQKQIFILGIISNTIITIILFQLLNKQYINLSNNLPILSYIMTILISLNLLKIIEINDIFNINNLHKNMSFIPFLYNYISGLIIGINSTSCTLPIILIILFWISYCESWVLGSIYIIVYLIGYTLPIYLIINHILNFDIMKKVPYLWNNINLYSGCLMLGYSIFSLLNILYI